jgi:hypothetical protein
MRLACLQTSLQGADVTGFNISQVFNLKKGVNPPCQPFLRNSLRWQQCFRSHLDSNSRSSKVGVKFKEGEREGWQRLKRTLLDGRGALKKGCGTVVSNVPRPGRKGGGFPAMPELMDVIVGC